jgi:Ca2+-binding EF-hand superfamily protein
MIRFRTALMAATLAAAVAAPALALAQPGHGHGHGSRGDRAMEREAFQERAGRMFERLDADADGFVTQAEAEAAETRMREAMEERRGRHGERGEHGPGRRAAAGPEAAERRLAAFREQDSDGDGRISRAEFDAARAARFAALDADGDGRVTREEMRARMGRGN